MAGEIMPSQYIHVLVPRICEYNLTWQKGLVNAIKDLEGDCPALSRWT